jgi:hypothetical protein
LQFLVGFEYNFRFRLQLSFLLMDGEENLLVESSQQFAQKLGCDEKSEVSSTASSSSKELAMIE